MSLDIQEQVDYTLLLIQTIELNRGGYGNIVFNGTVININCECSIFLIITVWS